jgi:WS/DGAT/MGAT family acyltransferase
MQQITPMDAAFLYLENESTHAHGTFVWFYDASECKAGTVNRKALLDHMRSRLHVSSIFTRKIHRLPMDFDYPYWVEDPGFELLYHVREQSSPAAEDWEGLCEQVAGFHSEPLNHDHPLWEMSLIPLLRNMPGLPENCFAILGKFHHVAIDGATGMDIIARIHDSESAARLPPQPAPGRADTPTLTGSLFRAAIRNLGALDTARKMITGGESRSEDTETVQEQEREELPIDENNSGGVPQTLFNQAVVAQRTWDSRIFELKTIKSLRKLHPGCTVNDVLLAICAGGLRRYLQAQGELPEQSMKAGCPINIRTEEESGAGGNRISAMIVPLYTSIEDPVKRLQAITRSTAIAKARIEARGSRKILELTAMIPAQTQALVGRLAGKATQMMNRAVKFNLSVSNLPGPQGDLSMLGGRLQSISAAMPVMPGFGLFLGLCTCAGRLTISMSSSANITPRIQDLGDCLVESFEEYEQVLARSRR